MGRWRVDLQIRTTEAAATGHHRWHDSDNKHPFLRALRRDIRDQGASRSGAWFRYACPCSVLTRPFLGTCSLFIRVLIIKSPCSHNLVHTQLPANALPPNPFPVGPRASVGEFGVGAGSRHCVHSSRLETQAGELWWPPSLRVQDDTETEQKTKAFSNKAKPAFLKKLIWLHEVLVTACGVFSCSRWTLVVAYGIQFPETQAPCIGSLESWPQDTREIPREKLLSPTVPAPEGLPDGSVIKNLPLNAETRVRSLVWEDPLEKKIAIHLSILAWRISWAEEPGGAQSTVSQRVRHDWVTECTHTSFRGITQIQWSYHHLRKLPQTSWTIHQAQWGWELGGGLVKQGNWSLSCCVFMLTVCSQGSYPAYWKHCLWSQTMEPCIQVSPFRQQICC